MGRNLCLYPMGSVDDFLLRPLVDCIQEKCRLECSIVHRIREPTYAFNAVRGQYDSRLILKNLQQTSRRSGHLVMGITNFDLFVSILKYVYGCAQIGGRCSIISLYRLRPEFHEMPPDPETLLSRVQKTALHELGHTIGLTHCRDRRCVMYSSANIEDTDNKSTGFCPTCAEIFSWFQDGTGSME